MAAKKKAGTKPKPNPASDKQAWESGKAVKLAKDTSK